MQHDGRRMEFERWQQWPTFWWSVLGFSHNLSVVLCASCLPGADGDGLCLRKNDAIHHCWKPLRNFPSTSPGDNQTNQNDIVEWKSNRLGPTYSELFFIERGRKKKRITQPTKNQNTHKNKLREKKRMKEWKDDFFCVSNLTIRYNNNSKSAVKVILRQKKKGKQDVGERERDLITHLAPCRLLGSP
jgi:hypothetical protein